ncbi:MAG: PAS domain-containing protein, partial [Candidatus Methylomirabilales bacterium]
PAVLYSFEASGDYAPTFISENLRKVFGYEPSEYLEDRNFVPDRIHPDDAARIRGNLSHLFKEGYLTHEYRFRRKDGHYCWVSDELKVIHDDAGKPVEVIGSWSDISARKAAEEALAAAHARINHILASSPAVLFSFEASGDYAPTFISENLRTVLGYEPSEYLEDPNFVPDRIHPDDAARIGGDLSHLYKKGHLINEYRFRHKEGSYRWVSDELRVIYDDAGKPVEVIGSWSDITKRKLAEEELQLRTREIARSLEELKALGEVSQAVNSTLDLQTVLTSIVSHAVQLSGADAGTIYEYDEQSEGFIPRATYQMKEDLIKTLRANPVRLGEGGVGRAAVARAPIQIPDIEKQGAYESRLQSLMAQSGFRAILSVPLLREDRIFGGLAVLRESPGEFPPEVVKLLQTFAAQSVLAIQNARLFRQIEEKAGQLEMASKYKSQFVANMSHEIRTPMNAIIGMTHLALQTELTERQRNYLGKVDTAAKGLLGVINDILDFSKIEAGKLHTERVDFSLDSVLEQVADVSAFKAQDKGLELLFDVGTDIPMALIGDPMRLRQVLLNLISNATKFTEKGEITVGVHLIAAQDSMAHLRFDVKDSGIGLTTEQRARLFSAFAQADASTTRK